MKLDQKPHATKSPENAWKQKRGSIFMFLNTHCCHRLLSSPIKRKRKKTGDCFKNSHSMSVSCVSAHVSSIATIIQMISEDIKMT